MLVLTGFFRRQQRVVETMTPDQLTRECWSRIHNTRTQSLLFLYHVRPRNTVFLVAFVLSCLGRLASDALAGGSLPLGQQEEANAPLFLFEGGHLCAALHGAGINLRYLPMVSE